MEILFRKNLPEKNLQKTSSGKIFRKSLQSKSSAPGLSLSKKRGFDTAAARLVFIYICLTVLEKKSSHDMVGTPHLQNIFLYSNIFWPGLGTRLGFSLLVHLLFTGRQPPGDNITGGRRQLHEKTVPSLKHKSSKIFLVHAVNILAAKILIQLIKRTNSSDSD